MIDPSGNIINRKAKLNDKVEQIIVPVEPEYTPPTVTTPPTENKVENKISSKIDELISKKIEEIVAKKIEEALNKL